ncbi:MAG: hypothetical protein QOE76_3345 [Frankiales bacterium]|nr:hypothetical protein [Frankiales bacterium]
MLTELDRLATIDPHAATPTSAWVTPAERRDILDAILTSPHSGGFNADQQRSASRSRPRRASGLVLGLATAAAVATITGAVSLPGLTSSAPRANAALEALAVAAGNAPADAVGAAQYRHLVKHLIGDGTSMSETWIAADGSAWRWDTFIGTKEYFAVPAPTEVATGELVFSPALLATLPTTSKALSHYLRGHVTGSNSTNDAVFTAVGDMFRAGFTPPKLRAAAIGVIEGLPHVTTQATTDLLGRPALAVTYNVAGVGSSLLFDRSTAVLLGEDLGPGFREAYTENIADSVPADVLSHAHMPTATPVGTIQATAQPTP